MQQTAFPIVCTNMDVSAEPVWPNPPIYVPSTVLERHGKKIGIIGYTTPDITWYKIFQFFYSGINYI